MQKSHTSTYCQHKRESFSRSQMPVVYRARTIPFVYASYSFNAEVREEKEKLSPYEDQDSIYHKEQKDLSRPIPVRPLGERYGSG